MYTCIKNSWLIIVLRPAQEFFTNMETSPLPWRFAKFRPMVNAQGFWAGRDLYRATPAVTRELGFPGLIRKTAPFSRLLRHTRGYGKSITRILTGPHSVAFYDTQGMWRTYSNPYPHLYILKKNNKHTLKVIFAFKGAVPRFW
jgi:hypothetical protein